MNRDVVRILVTLLVLSAGISMGSGGVVTDHGNTTDTAPTSGQETRDAVFKGPHLGWWCQNTVGEPVDETVHETTP
jgi:hypothetical protein